MIKRTLSEIAKMIDAKIPEDFKDTQIEGVSIDSRTIDKGNLYIPIVGEKFDGRIFIKECEKKGASAFIIDEDYNIAKNIEIPYIIVKDTKKALQELAKAYRAQLNTKIIGITGSNGKTTTKDLIYSVVEEKYKVKKTLGNLNNEIGLPKTILRLDDDTEVAIIEMGTEDFGEISLLTDIAKPDIAIITNIGDSHLLRLKSKEGIAHAKFEIIEGLKNDGIFIYNGDDPTLKKVIKEYDIKQKIIKYGVEEDNDVIIKEISSSLNGNIFEIDGKKYHVPLLGNHQKYNGAVAVILANILDIDYDKIKKGLMDVKATENRNEIIECEGFDILNDAYKSNPQSLSQAIDTLSLLQGYKRKIAVLGDMLDLGDGERMLHLKAGEKLDPKKINYIVLIGELSKDIYKGALKNFPKSRVYHFKNKDDLIDEMKYIIIKSTIVLVKGSRAMHMEEIIEGIRDLKVS
ncbi:MAG: UDP-N-acetylmuramoyl-tripeptide--D-alanyl-D-alanine ligase [Tissierellia bacterium]|nr:UDP-N-acetylmuramoyl-tripeptide--D-alanyl-D-alanine ligase [Tissierellia bacterium]